MKRAYLLFIVLILILPCSGWTQELKDAEDKGARIYHARTLAWDGKLEAAFRESSALMDMYPGDPDVWLLHADILRWKGDQKGAIKLYEDILSREPDNFNARLGISYSHLWSGNIALAAKMSKELYSISPENRDVIELRNLIRDRTQPSGGIGYSIYEDTDDNRLNTYRFNYEFLPLFATIPIKRIRAEYSRASAHNELLKNSASKFDLLLYTAIRDIADLNINVAVVDLARDGRDSTTHLTGGAVLNVPISNGRIRVSTSRAVMIDTAEIIENAVRVNTSGIGMEKGIGESFVILGDYLYRTYSDGNRSDDFMISPRIIARRASPRIQFGYRFRGLDFKRDTDSGYFDPHNFQSHQILTSLYGEKEGLYYSFDAFGGRQSFDRATVSSRDNVLGASGSMGYRISPKVLVEIYGEAGNYALQAATGFRMWTIGGNIRISLPGKTHGPPS